MLCEYISERFDGCQDRDSASQRTTFHGGTILECGITGFSVPRAFKIQTSLLIPVHHVPKWITAPSISNMLWSRRVLKGWGWMYVHDLWSQLCSLMLTWFNHAGWTVYMSQLMHKTCAATGSRQPVINYDNEEHFELHQVRSIYILCVYLPQKHC